MRTIYKSKKYLRPRYIISFFKNSLKISENIFETNKNIFAQTKKIENIFVSNENKKPCVPHFFELSRDSLESLGSVARVQPYGLSEERKLNP